MKLDLHVHTKYSGDSFSTPKSLVRAAVKKGLDGFAVTDHNTAKAWKEAKLWAKLSDIKVVLGEEVKVYKGEKKIGEILGLFLTEKIKSRDYLEVIDEIKKQGGVAIIAHPFQRGRGFKKTDEVKKLVHGIEGFNSRVLFNKSNEQALDFAEKNRLALTAGSDAHTHYEIGNAWTRAHASDLEDFRKAIKNRKTQIWGKKNNIIYHVHSTLAKIF